MNDEHERAQREADALAASNELEQALCAVLNDPSKQWARVPHIVTTALAELLVRVLVAMAQSHPDDLGFGLRLVDQVQRQLIARAGSPTTPGETLH